MAAGAVITGIAALVAAIGSGISSATSTSADERMARQEREAKAEELRKQRKQEQFQFGYSSLLEQRRAAEQTAKRSMFNKQVFQALGTMKGAPAVSTF